MKDLKYLIAFVPIIGVYIGLYLGGWYTYLGIIIAFGIVPSLELILKGNGRNLTYEEEQNVAHRPLFDWLLYLNLPLLYGLIGYFFYTLIQVDLATYEIVGMTISVGVINGTAGINVAHELGHRNTRYEQFLSQLLLLPNLYMHFFIEHNLGHHKHVATKNDPASARLGEPIHFFCIRSVVGGYLSAWKIEGDLLAKQGKSKLSTNNRMIWYLLIQVAYLSLVGWFGGVELLKFAVWIAAIGFLLLESVNYIEHYGLRRKRLPSGRYEPVTPNHSWNSNHDVGRIILYELTRHADHHYKSTRKYQILRHYDDSPQLPMGYPAAIILAWFPPLWFALMNAKVRALEQR